MLKGLSIVLFPFRARSRETSISMPSTSSPSSSRIDVKNEALKKEDHLEMTQGKLSLLNHIWQ